MIRRTSLLAAFAVPAFLASIALAGGDADPKKGGGPKKSDEPAKPEAQPKKDAPEKAKPDAYKGPEIAWVTSFAEARDEAMERNVAIYIHSHGST
jgi:hypothetical protein